MRRRREDEGEEARRRRREEPSSVLSILGSCSRKMILCCCWPLGKCAKVLAAFDFLIVGFFFIKSCELLMETANDLHWTTIVSFLFFLGFIICQALGLFFIVLAAKKKCARYCLPRLVLIAGLTVCSLIVLIFMLTYFAGSAQSVNNFLFKVYEYFFGTVLTDAERVELKHELRYYGAAFFVLAALFFIYNVFALWLTIKFKQTLNEFEPVPTEPTAPQLAHNPAYAEPPLKSYPNMA
ncbi:hypothetical protein L5515_012558 [Caenorhabditis briggsae]|uniref:Uncharacterized protein n=1 Tax=Caenorhabditis briggsae TaxID=6238 RepID=A0AAE9JH91_CAEBR|nr:hypothetical protein L5515_012558 [Caenorhabditis briggsae]